MEIPSEIIDLVHFVGGEVVFVDTYGGGMTSYHCEQREGVRNGGARLPTDFQVRVGPIDSKYQIDPDVMLLFAGRDGKTVELTLRWSTAINDARDLTLVMPEDI